MREHEPLEHIGDNVVTVVDELLGFGHYRCCGVLSLIVHLTKEELLTGGWVVVFVNAATHDEKILFWLCVSQIDEHFCTIYKYLIGWFIGQLFDWLVGKFIS